MIGMGSMGGAVAAALASRGLAVKGFDVRPEAMTAAAGAGVLRATSPRDAATGVDAVLLSLPDAPDVARALEGGDGILAAPTADLAILDMTTLSPGASAEFTARVPAFGKRYYDTPIVGSPASPAARTLRIFAGMTEAEMAPFAPLFDALGPAVAMGGRGRGIAFKIIAILLSGMNVAVLAEIFALGVKLGLEPSKLHQMLMGTGGASFALEHKIGQTVLPGAYYPAPFRLDLMVKDTTIGVGEASRVGVPLPIASIVNQMYRMASAEGWGDADSGAICELYASLAGVRISADPQSYKKPPRPAS